MNKPGTAQAGAAQLMWGEYDRSFKHLVPEKNCIEIFRILGFGSLALLCVIYYISGLWVLFSRTAEGLGPQYQTVELHYISAFSKKHQLKTIKK